MPYKLYARHLYLLWYLFQKYLDSGAFDCYTETSHRHFMLQVSSNANNFLLWLVNITCTENPTPIS